MKLSSFSFVNATIALVLLSQTALASDRFTYSTNGAEVTDTTTGLTWRRCSEGQQFSYDRCDGKPTEHNFKGAIAHAKMQATPEATWRVPNINELSTLVEKRVRNPSIDTNVFPNTAANRYWSSSAHETDVTQGMIVYFNDGHVVKYHQNNKAHVRLVRN
jgi:Protein of unknown function (DUF1566)